MRCRRRWRCCPQMLHDVNQGMTVFMRHSLFRSQLATETFPLMSEIYCILAINRNTSVPTMILCRNAVLHRPCIDVRRQPSCACGVCCSDTSLCQHQKQHEQSTFLNWSTCALHLVYKTELSTCSHSAPGVASMSSSELPPDANCYHIEPGCWVVAENRSRSRDWMLFGLGCCTKSRDTHRCVPWCWGLVFFPWRNVVVVLRTHGRVQHRASRNHKKQATMFQLNADR